MEETWIIDGHFGTVSFGASLFLYVLYVSWFFQC